MKEYKVGEEFEFEGVRLRVEKCNTFLSCEDCFFIKYRIRCYLMEDVGFCNKSNRTDGVNVKFVKVEEDGNN